MSLEDQMALIDCYGLRADCDRLFEVFENRKGNGRHRKRARTLGAERPERCRAGYRRYTESQRADAVHEVRKLIGAGVPYGAQGPIVRVVAARHGVNAQTLLYWLAKR